MENTEQMNIPIELYTPKEIALIIKRPVKFVYQMRKRGLKMIGHRTTIQAALDWLDKHPNPYKRIK